MQYTLYMYAHNTYACIYTYAHNTRMHMPAHTLYIHAIYFHYIYTCNILPYTCNLHAHTNLINIR